MFSASMLSSEGKKREEGSNMQEVIIGIGVISIVILVYLTAVLLKGDERG